MDSPERNTIKADPYPPPSAADLSEDPESAASALDYLICLHEYLPLILHFSSHCDGRWLIRYVSPGIREALGYKPEELVGRLSWDDLSPGGDEAGRSWPETVQGRRRYRYSRTFLLRSASGELKSFSDNGVILYDRSGRLSATAGVYVDLGGQDKWLGDDDTARADAHISFDPEQKKMTKAGRSRTDLLSALGLNLWNITRTANYLGWSRATVYRKMKQWRLRRPLPMSNPQQG